MADEPVLTIGDRAIGAEEALQLSRRHIGPRRTGDWLGPILAELVVRTVAEREGLPPISDEELQEGVDAYRRALGLYTAEDTERWLAGNHLLLEDLEQGVETNLLYVRWAERAVKDRVQPYFEEHRLDFERVGLSMIVVADEAIARELVEQIEEGAADFATLARAYSVDESAVTGGYLGWVLRGSLPPPIESAVYGARDRLIVGPLRYEDEHYIFRIEGFAAADLTADLVLHIREMLMQPVVAAAYAALAPRVHRDPAPAGDRH